ncbi:sensor histidine kinase [Kitasatospora sp. NBC_00315]|uniref:sensor histidine kinase n=1 Tax=Kitasatospora sp. NBC_00315 TaxID=2975963 RepID=UPI0032495321
MAAVTPTNDAPTRVRAGAVIRTGAQALPRSCQVVLGSLPGVLVPVFGAVVLGAVLIGAFGDTDRSSWLVLLAAGVALLTLAGLFVRWNADLTRAQVMRWYGVRLPATYTNRPALELDERGHWWTGYSYHRSHAVARLGQLLHWSFRDPITRREIGWLLLNPAAAASLLGPVFVLMLGGALFALTPGTDSRTYGGIASGGLSVLLSLVIGALLVVGGLLLLPHAMRAHSELARRVLDPAGQSSREQLTRRVARLTETRAEAVGSQAAELRRIERDLHDGAQARLVAIGMTLGTIEHLMDSNPAAARELLAEARQSSAKALQELRDLVRGIHPPVLAERGLGDAVRALALDSALPAEVCVSLPDRPPAPVEAAVYFSVCELMANAAKHSGADRLWVDILHRAGSLRVTVTDDGHGVADPSKGSGLRGIERRLGTFDGVLAIDSTSGGPTTITLELPCELSSPRTSTSSGKA